MHGFRDVETHCLMWWRESRIGWMNGVVAQAQKWCDAATTETLRELFAQFVKGQNHMNAYYKGCSARKTRQLDPIKSVTIRT